MNTDKARAILPYVGVAARDERGLASRLLVPAGVMFAEGKRGGVRTASVTITRSGDTLTCDCRIVGQGDAAEGEQCIGMLGGALCYHAVAAILARLEEVAVVSFDGRGKLVSLQAAYGGGRGVVSLTSKGKPAATKPAWATRVDRCECGATLTPGQLESGLCIACDRSVGLQPLPVRLIPSA